MEFDKWAHKQFGNPYGHAITYSVHDVRAAWNKSKQVHLDAAIEAVNKNQCDADGYHACSQQDVFIEAIEKLKE